MNSSINHHRRTVNNIKIHYVDAGSGPPVVLLHGFPETWHAWRHQIPVLSESYRLIIPDLRGYGTSDKPTSGYDKRSMAKDVKELLAALNIEKAAVIGHDRGARVGTRLVKDYPDIVARFAALDNIPTRVIFDEMNAELAQAAWFFLFNGVRDLPEALIQGREELWLRHIFASWTYDISAFSDTDIDIYARVYSAPGGLRGAFEDYRAWREDLKQDHLDADTKIACPTLALWGAEFDGAKFFDMVKIWQEMALDLRTAAIPLAGHFPQAERPEETNEELMVFLRDWKG